MHAARATQADAIHPGYGFLVGARRARPTVRSLGVVFIGPTAAQIEAVGDKLRARARGRGGAGAGGARLRGDVRWMRRWLAARTIGAPLLVKAVGGGGGRGMKRVDSTGGTACGPGTGGGGSGRRLRRCAGLPGALHRQRPPCRSAGTGRWRGRVIHLGERDCSTQRRYQKLVEETPAPGLSAALRERAACRGGALRTAACRIAARARWSSWSTRSGTAFYFLEMNARIQVEHPVTEAVTGVDLIAEQIAIASGSRTAPGAVRHSHHRLRHRVPHQCRGSRP